MNRPQKTPQERARDTETAAAVDASVNGPALSELEYLTLIEVLNRAPITAGERLAINGIMAKLSPAPALPERAPGPERAAGDELTADYERDVRRGRTFPVNLPDDIPAEPGQVP